MALIPLLALLACGGPGPAVDSAVPEAAAELISLSDAALLRRLSLDLRGTLPTLEELDAIEADPAALDTFRTELLDDPRLEDRVVALLAERWHTRVDVFDIEYGDYGFSAAEEFAFERSVGEEPLRLAAKVVVEDRPWSEVVTADATVANELLAEIWPLDYPAGESGWQWAPYTDGRPAAGVLSTNGLWWRYNTNLSNMNRARAATIARIFLCVDMLGRPVSFGDSAGLDAEGGTEDAVHSDPACLSCHAAIDPIAASLFGFWWVAQYSVEEETWYHAERELLGPQWLGVEPAFFGQPVGGLAQLGPIVAADRRFDACAVQTFTEALWRRPTSGADLAELDALRGDYQAGEERIRPLLAAITRSSEYAAAGGAGLSPDARPAHLLSPSQLSTALADLSGFEWTWKGFDQLDNDDIGYRVLGGGVDGASVYSPQTSPGLTLALVFQRAAEAAASTLVQRDLVVGSHLLLQGVELDTDPEDPAFTQLLTDLGRRLTGQRPSEEELAAQIALFEALDAGGDREEAWTGLLSALLRDPEFLVY